MWGAMYGGPRISLKIQYTLSTLPSTRVLSRAIHSPQLGAYVLPFFPLEREGTPSRDPVSRLAHRADGLTHLHSHSLALVLYALLSLAWDVDAGPVVVVSECGSRVRVGWAGAYVVV